jgi:hypothetical protein
VFHSKFKKLYLVKSFKLPLELILRELSIRLTNLILLASFFFASPLADKLLYWNNKTTV